MTEVSSRTTRAQRMAMPLAREVVKDLAGQCIPDRVEWPEVAA